MGAVRLHARIVCVLVLLSLGLHAQEDEKARRDAALARQIAWSIEVFTLYTGKWPATLEDLTHKPDWVTFWPEGGFWLGTLPEGVEWKAGAVVCGKTSEKIGPPTGEAIVPPTDRLKIFYAERVRLHLVRAAAEAHLKIHGELPSSLENVPKSIRLEVSKKRLRIRSEAKEIWEDSLTEAERAGLTESARVRITEEERKSIHALIDKLADDDYETREEASEKLYALGPCVGDLLRDRAASEKDPEVLGRVQRLADFFPELPPAWRTELRSLTTIVIQEPDLTADDGCRNNLQQLWTMMSNYQVQYGGTQKSLPGDPYPGGKFWLKLSTPPTVLIDSTLREVYTCPVSGEEVKEGETSYSGPARDVNHYGDGDPVGMCDHEGHGGVVIVLRKSGDVQVVPRGNPLHRMAMRLLKR